jgi:hypothetical protein
LLRLDIDTIRRNLRLFWQCHLILSFLCIGQLLFERSIQVAEPLIQSDQRLGCIRQFLPELRVDIHHMLFEIFGSLDLVSKLHNTFPCVSARSTGSKKLCTAKPMKVRESRMRGSKVKLIHKKYRDDAPISVLPESR